LLPSAESILQPGFDNAILDRLVQQKVAEIMAEREAAAGKSHSRYDASKPLPEQESWHVFFERHGCLLS
jgi:hypothetical protein